MTSGRWTRGLPRKILLATDLSARCDRAFDRAVALAGAWQAQLIAVHAMAPEGVSGGLDVAMDAGVGSIPSWRRPSDPQKLAEARIRAELQERAPDVTVVIEPGEPADVILRAIDAHECDLIVTGVARDEPLGRLVLGSTVERLARASRLPILVVRKRGHRPYRHVVAATDLSDASRYALEAAARLFPAAKLTVFHAYDVPLRGLAADPASHTRQFRAAAVQATKSFLAQADLGSANLKPEVLVEDGEPERLLHAYATDMDVDLVALGSHAHGAVFEMLLGSVAQGLLCLLPCDVLLVREPEAAPAA